MAAVALPSTGNPPTGRPVDVEIVPRPHAVLSASSSERWLTCTPSARIEESLADGDSSYASEGTAGHAFAEIELRHWLGEMNDAERDAAIVATRFLYAEHITAWSQYDWDSIDVYTDFVKARVAEYGGVQSESNPNGVQVTIEARVDYSMYAQGGFGTSDTLLVSGNLGIVEAIDLKFGKGVPVYAENNPQPRIYTLGGFLGIEDAELRRKITRFRSVIVQPRLDSISEAEIDRAQMIDWAENVVRPKALLAYEGKGELDASNEHACRFCKARSRCRALTAKNVLLAQKEMAPFMSKPDDDGVRTFDPEEFLLSPAEVARILPEIDQFLSWGNRLKEFALEEARDNGTTIPGYKLVRGRKTRTWAKDTEVVATLLATQDGITEAEIFEPPKPRTIRTAPAFEKQVGVKRMKELDGLFGLIEEAPGKPTLVPEKDPRQAIDKVAEAAADFGLLAVTE